MMKKWGISALLSLVVTALVLVYMIFIEWGVEYAQANLQKVFELVFSVFVLSTLILRLILAAVIHANKMKSDLKYAEKHKLKMEEIEKQRLLTPCNFELVSGIGITEGLICKLIYQIDKEHIEINGGGTQYTLKLEKIRDITIMTDVDIQKQAVSSIGGAVIGQKVFGTLGAIIGGRAKVKTIETVSKYLIFTCTTKNEEIDYVSFDVTGFVKEAEAQKLVTEFAKRPKIIHTAEL